MSIGASPQQQIVSKTVTLVLWTVSRAIIWVRTSTAASENFR